MADWASESGHWYDRDGTPQYTVNGRDSTLRDARKHGWYPGATTIIGQASRFQLEQWKQKQVLLAGLTLPRLDGESDDAWMSRVFEDADQQREKAAARGTEIHAAVEAFYTLRTMDLMYLSNRPWKESLHPWVMSIVNIITQTFGQQAWRPEKSFASPLGYGGKVDLHSDSVLLDLKGKEAKAVHCQQHCAAAHNPPDQCTCHECKCDGKRLRDWRIYDEHAMQLAAYAHGLQTYSQGYPDKTFIPPRCGIIFFDRDEPYSEFHEVKAAELERGWLMFRALLDYYYAKTGLQR